MLWNWVGMLIAFQCVVLCYFLESSQQCVWGAWAHAFSLNQHSYLYGMYFSNRFDVNNTHHHHNGYEHIQLTTIENKVQILGLFVDIYQICNEPKKLLFFLSFTLCRNNCAQDPRNKVWQVLYHSRTYPLVELLNYGD